MFFIYGYAIFNIILGILSLKRIPNKNVVFIELSGLLIFISAFFESTLILLIGLVINQLVMISNGYHMNGKINIKHHIIRLVINIILVTYFLYYSS